jgi:hypothetical protein
MYMRTSLGETFYTLVPTGMTSIIGFYYTLIILRYYPTGNKSFVLLGGIKFGGNSLDPKLGPETAIFCDLTYNTSFQI